MALQRVPFSIGHLPISDARRHDHPLPDHHDHRLDRDRVRHGLGCRPGHSMKGQGVRDCRESRGVDRCDSRDWGDNDCHPSRNPAAAPAGNSAVQGAVRNNEVRGSNSVAGALYRFAAPGNTSSDSHCHRHIHLQRQLWAGYTQRIRSNRDLHSNQQESEPVKQAARVVDTWRPPGPR